MNGGRLIVIAAVVSIAVVVLALRTHGTAVDGWLAATRATARVSLLVYLAVAVASSIHVLWGGALGKWLMANRRALGLALVVSHLVHAISFMRYASAKHVSIVGVASVSTLYGGGLGYVILAAMAATSNNAAVKRLGRARWKALHKTGIYVLGAIFLATYLSRAVAGDTLAIASTTALLGVFGLRAAARLTDRQRRRLRGSATPR